MLANAYKVNAFINDIQTFTEDELSAMVKDNSSIDLERLSYMVSCKINGSESDNEQKENSKVVYYCKNLIEAKNNSIGVTTYRSYNQTIKLLDLYEKKHTLTLKFDDIDLSFYRRFVILLEDENYSLNSIGKHVKNLKIFFK